MRRVKALCKWILAPFSKDSDNAAVRNPALEGIEPGLFSRASHQLSFTLVTFYGESSVR